MSLQILAVEVEGWPGLNNRVRVELNAERTVLVGKNGAGKSVVLGAMVQGASLAMSGAPPSGRRRPPIEGPRSFKCEVGTPGAVHYSYEYQLSYTQDDTEDPTSSPGRQGSRVLWTERCSEAG